MRGCERAAAAVAPVPAHPQLTLPSAGRRDPPRALPRPLPASRHACSRLGSGSAQLPPSSCAAASGPEPSFAGRRRCSRAGPRRRPPPRLMCRPLSPFGCEWQHREGKKGEGGGSESVRVAPALHAWRQTCGRPRCLVECPSGVLKMGLPLAPQLTGRYRTAGTPRPAAKWSSLHLGRPFYRKIKQ